MAKNIFQNPKVRVAIVVIVVAIIAVGIGLLMSTLLKPPPKQCSGNTHLDTNTGKCVPNCQDGYANDPTTGDCVIQCPAGKVSSKSLSGVTIPGEERCVIPCGSAYCDPETSKTLCQDNVCYTPNCKTTSDEASYCNPPKICGTDSSGNKKTTLPSGTTLDSDGCYTHNSPVPTPAPQCPTATPNMVTGTGAYKHEHVCCKTTEFAIYTSQGEPFCCPDETDVIIDRKCCPQAQQCTYGGQTICLTTDQVCTPEGPCETKYAIGSTGNYTGCCPFPTSNGECYNMCTYVGSDETGMEDTCTTDADCGFKSGFSFDGIQTAGGKCDSGKCKLYCGPADADTQGDISCLNDPNSKKSTCINTTSMCKFTENNYNPEQSNGAYICNDSTSNFWKSSSGAPILTVSAGVENPDSCSALSCLDRMITGGLLGATGDITQGTKQRTLPVTSASSTPSVKDKTCIATIECNKMKLTQGGNQVSWSDQIVNNNNVPVVLNTIAKNVFNGSYSGAGGCNPAATPGDCVFLPTGEFSKFGTYDGKYLSSVLLSGTGCAPASWGNPSQTYPEGILCSVDTVVNSSGGNKISPNYYCKSWDTCCGEGGLISSSDYSMCVCLSNATNVNGVCEYITDTNGDGIISTVNPANAAGWPPSSTIRNAAYLSLRNTMSPSWVDTNLGYDNKMILKYSQAIVVMSINGKYIGFNSSKNLGTVSSSSPINFYYSYYDAQPIIKNVWPYGQIVLVKGFFRFGSGTAYDSDINNNDLGRPVRVYNSVATRDTTWGGSTQFDSGDILTLVKSSGKWYLAATKCFYWKAGVTYGIQEGDAKIVYATYNSTTETFAFTTNNPATATPINLNYVFSAVPGATSNSDDQFLSGITTADLLTKAHADGTTGLITFGQLAANVKASV